MRSAHQERAWRGGSGPIGVLDVGTSKAVCLIASVEPRADAFGGVPRVQVLGIGHQRSRGVKAGVVVDLEEAEHAVRDAVGEAERMAGLTLETVQLAVACGRLKSSLFTANAEVGSGAVADEDIRRVMAGARAYAEREGRTLVHLNRLGFRIDGAARVEDPRGMAATRLAADVHAITADDAPVRNLAMVVERCHLGISGLVAAPYASSLAAATADERRIGVTTIDIGAGAVTIAASVDGHLVHVDVLPVGGHHVTYDIARALNTPLAEAERIKVLYGTLIGAASDDHEAFEYPLAGEDEATTNRVTRAQLRSVIRPRIDGMLRLIAERLGNIDRVTGIPSAIVLTGGASQLIGLADVAAAAFGRPVRVAGALQVAGLPSGMSRPAFSVAAGLLVSSVQRVSTGIAWREPQEGGGAGYLGRVGSWLREGF